MDNRADVKGSKGQAATGSDKEYMAYDKGSGVSAALEALEGTNAIVSTQRCWLIRAWGGDYANLIS